jgi:hypothetical protein
LSDVVALDDVGDDDHVEDPLKPLPGLVKRVLAAVEEVGELADVLPLAWSSRLALSRGEAEAARD